MDSVLPDYIKSLHRTSIFSHNVENVVLIQTHISYVILAGDFVYKWKKPVDFGFLNFSDLPKRKKYCEEELRLNRRLCPDLYLNLVALCDVNGEHVLRDVDDIDGDVVEYGVKMSRMDQSKLMGELLAQDAITEKHLDKIVDKLVPFYEQAEWSDELNEFGTAKGFGVNVHENFEQTVSFIGGGALDQESFDLIKEYSLNLLSHEDLFEERIKAGKVRDCHGDLYSANICLEEDVQIFDCIEFNERFRYSDVAADIGFLAMDLDFHGKADLANYFVDRYVQISGDATLLKVINFYKIYRAYVRAKIALFTSTDPNVSEDFAKECVTTAGKYFQLAVGYCK